MNLNEKHSSESRPLNQKGLLSVLLIMHRIFEYMSALFKKHACIHVCMYVCMYVRTYVCMVVVVVVCVCVCVCTYILHT